MQILPLEAYGTSASTDTSAPASIPYTQEVAAVIAVARSMSVILQESQTHTLLVVSQGILIDTMSHIQDERKYIVRRAEMRR